MRRGALENRDMKQELTPEQQWKVEMAWSELNLAKAYAAQGRIARAQDALLQALSFASPIPSWYTDEVWAEQYDQLHRQLYSGT